MESKYSSKRKKNKIKCMPCSPKKKKQSQQELTKYVSHHITLMLTLLFPFSFIQTLFPLVSPPLLFWCDDSLA